MSVETFSPQDAVTVTPAAQEHFSRQAVAGQAVRLSVKSSGCTGYKYVVDIVDASEAGDICIALANGLALYVAADALAMVQGTEIDYAKEGLNRTLKFHNPNVADECGCGESFNVN